MVYGVSYLCMFYIKNDTRASEEVKFTSSML